MNSDSMRWPPRKHTRSPVACNAGSASQWEVEALADRIAIMVAGRTIAIGTVAELKKQTGENNLEDAFVKLVGGNNELA